MLPQGLVGPGAPLTHSQAYPAKLESPHPKAYRVPSIGLASAAGKSIREGQFSPLAPGTRVSTWQRPLALSVLRFYIYIYISIILLKKRKNHFDPFLGQRLRLWMQGRVSGKGLASWHRMAHSSWTFLVMCPVRPVGKGPAAGESVSCWTAGFVVTG